jgi:hypothetical protein
MMSEAKTAPGPWSVDGNGIKAMVRGADATIVAVRHRLPADANESNMRLIAAAPDLLAALQGILVDEGQDLIRSRLWDVAHAAIALATEPR